MSARFAEGDRVFLLDYGDEVFAIVGFRANGMLADLESEHRTQQFCAPISSLTAAGGVGAREDAT